MKVACLYCDKKLVKIEVHEETGYIEVKKGIAIVNCMSDGSTTVDFYCSEGCKDS